MKFTPPRPNLDGEASSLKSVATGINSERIAVADAAIFYSAVSMIIAILVAYFRQPFGSPGVTVISAYWVSAAVTMCAYAMPFLVRDDREKHGVFALASLLATSALVTAAGYWGLAIVVVAISIGGWVIRHHFRSIALPSVTVMMAASLVAAVFATACFVLVNSMQYATVFSPERALAGILHHDQLFHASIASMFAHYGVAGTGLDGLQPFRYHLLSHVWLGIMAKGFGVNSIFGYFLGMQIIAVPLLYFSLTVATTAFVERSTKPDNRVLQLAMPIAVLFTFEQWNWLSYLVSESHILGLILFLCALPMLRRVAHEPGASFPYIFIAAGFAVGLLALAAKVSIGFVWFAGFLYLSVRMNRLSRLQFALCGALLLVTFWVAVTYLLPIEHSDNSSFAPFHFFRSYRTAAIANLIPIVLAAALQIALCRSSSRPERVWRETIVIMLMASAAPTFVLQLDGGSAYYFINIGTWIAVAALAGQAISVCRLAASRVVLTACIVVITASFLYHPDKRSAYRKFNAERDQLAEYVLQHAIDPEIKGASVFSRAALVQMAEAIKSTVGGKLSQAFESAGLRVGDETIVFVEPGVEEFWSMHPICAMPQFLVPSYFAVPLLKGLPPVERGCELGIYYSLPSYGPDAASSAATETALCHEALARGFSTVLRVSSVSTTRKVVCN